MAIRLRHKYAAIFIAVCFLFQGLFIFPAKASTVVDGGSWGDDEQAVRLSVFDPDTGTTLATRDFMYDGERYDGKRTYEGSYRWLTEHTIKDTLSTGRKMTVGIGCKLDYVIEHVYNGVAIKDLDIKCYTQDLNSFGNSCVTYFTSEKLDEFGDVKETLKRFLTPLKELDRIGNVYEYSGESISEFLKNEILQSYAGAAAFEIMLRQMGFSIKGADGYEDLNPNYIVVIEPVYWFVNEYSKANGYKHKQEVFYGSATEWAIYSQKTLGTEPYSYWLSSTCYGYGIHSVMGNLTCSAGVMSCYPTKERKFSIGGYEDREPLTFEAVGIDTELYDEIDTIWKSYRRTINNPGRDIDYIDETILTKLGVDFLCVNDLYDLSVEIVNSAFRPNTEAVLSFELETTLNANGRYMPAYSDVAAYQSAPDDAEKSDYYYGIKLVLETVPGSQVKLYPITLYCDGLPDTTEGKSVSTYIYDGWEVPNVTGIWEFTVTAYPANGSDPIKYESNTATLQNPEARDDDSIEKEYVFSITISDVGLEDPPNTASSDLKPQNFTSPSGEIVGHTPVTTLEWNTYTASLDEESDGKKNVKMEENVFSKTINIEDTDIVSYENIRSADYNNDRKLVTKSGYGIGVSAVSEVSGNTDGLDSGCQSGVVLYPEYGYIYYGTLLEPDGDGNLYMETNEYSKYKDDPAHREYSRVHFTPIWYPDGEYNVQVFLFDCWTPAGMLWDCLKCTAIIDGNMYDDWYVTRR